MPNTREKEKLIELLNKADGLLKELCGGLNDNNGNGVRADLLIANGVTVQPLYGQHTNRICGPIDEVYLNRIRDLEHQLQLAYSEINHLRMLPFPRPLMPRWRAAEELPVLRTEVYNLGEEQVTEETSEPVIGLCTNGDIVPVRYVRSEWFSGWVETEYAGSRQVAYWMPLPKLPEEIAGGEATCENNNKGENI